MDTFVVAMLILSGFSSWIHAVLVYRVRHIQVDDLDFFFSFIRDVTSSGTSIIPRGIELSTL